MNYNNGFTWSFSRSSIFNECRRKYYYYTYAKVAGKTPEASDLQKKCYFLSNITNMHFLNGSITHEVIALALSDCLINGVKKEANFYIDCANEKWDQALEVNQYFLKHNKEPSHRELRLITQETYNNRFCDLSEWEKYKSRTSSILRSLLDSVFWEELTDVSKVEYLGGDCTDDRFQTVELENINCYILPDVVYKDRQTGRICIIDWKTGNPRPKDIDQASFYAMALSKLKNIACEQLDIKLVYVSNGYTKKDGSYPYVESFRFNDFYNNAAITYLIKTTSMMLNYVQDKTLNIPLPLQSFEPTNDAEVCRFCQFFEVCDDSPLKVGVDYRLKKTGDRDEFFDV